MYSFPQISVVLPVHNGSRFLSESIDSILCQSFTNFELIIVDDCSTDNSLNIAYKYSKKDSRIKILTNKQNLKLPMTLNKGFASARSPFYTWTSDDNKLLPDCLYSLFNAAVTSHADIVYSNYREINEDGEVLTTQACRASPNINELLLRNVIGASFLFSCNTFNKLDGYKNLFFIEDYDFWVRAYLKKFTFYYIDSILYEYRIHSNSLTSTNDINAVVIPYRYAYRNKFRNIPRISQYMLRMELFSCGSDYLTIIQRLILIIESLYFSPLQFYKKLLKFFKLI